MKGGLLSAPHLIFFTILHSEMLVRQFFGLPGIVFLMPLYGYYYIIRRKDPTPIIAAVPLLVVFISYSITRTTLWVFDKSTIDFSFIYYFLQAAFKVVVLYAILKDDEDIGKVFFNYSLVIVIFYCLSMASFFSGGAFWNRFLSLKYFGLGAVDYSTLSINSSYIGLSNLVPTFSYQALLAACFSTVLVFGRKPSLGALLLFLLSIASVVTTAERSSFLAFLLYFTLYFIYSFRKANARSIALNITIILVILGFGFLNWGMIKAYGEVFSRLSKEGFEDSRFSLAFEAFISPLRRPIGNGALTPEYIKNATEAGFVDHKTREVLVSHNHFANVAMYLGVLGYALIGAFAYQMLYYCRKALRRHNESYPLVLSLIATLVNSFAHNAGFFTAESATIVVATCIVYLGRERL